MAVQALLRLSSRGEALVAELLRLSAHVPHLFSLTEKTEQKQFGDVLLDFRYLKTPELCEHRIETSPELIARDAEVWEAHESVITRLFSLFEAVYTYIKDFAKCVNDLREGIYIQQTVEGVLEHDDGKQLMCEVLYLYGVLLTLMDTKVEGSVRERIVIAYYRHKGQSSIMEIDEICLLVKATGYFHNVLDRNGLPKRPAGYPEEYFGRFIRKLAIDPNLISMMVARLRSEDMYSQIPSYPLPQHRSTALATQARILYRRHVLPDPIRSTSLRHSLHRRASCTVDMYSQIPSYPLPQHRSTALATQARILYRRHVLPDPIRSTGLRHSLHRRACCTSSSSSTPRSWRRSTTRCERLWISTFPIIG